MWDGGYYSAGEDLWDLQSAWLNQGEDFPLHYLLARFANQEGEWEELARMLDENPNLDEPDGLGVTAKGYIAANSLLAVLVKSREEQLAMMSVCVNPDGKRIRSRI